MKHHHHHHNNKNPNNSSSFTAKLEQIQAQIFADGRAARELLHAQVDEILLCAYDQSSSSAEVAANAHRLAQLNKVEDNAGGGGNSGGNLVLQNMLTQLEQLRGGGRKSAGGSGAMSSNSSSSSYGRSSLGSKSTPERPLSLEMIGPLYGYFVGHQPQVPSVPSSVQKPNSQRKSASKSSSASSSSSKSSSSTHSSLSSFTESSSSSSSTTLSNLAPIHKLKNNNANTIDYQNNKPLEWSPSSSGYSSTEEELLSRSSNNNNANNGAPVLPLDLSTRKSQNQQQQQQKFSAEMYIGPKLVIKEEEEEEESSMTAKPSFMLPLKKRKYADMVTNDSPITTIDTSATKQLSPSPASPPTPSSSSAKAVVFQDELLNNFAQANRKENMLTVGRKCLIDDCPTFFTDKRSMHGHMAVVHGVLQFACQVVGCVASFEVQQGLTAHLSEAHSGAASFGCPKCGKPFRKYESMSHHIYAEHAVGVFRCAIAGCGFEGARRSEVSRHFERVHRKYSCAFCERSFTYTGHLRTHERTHLRVKPFSCTWPDCGYLTENKSHVVSHIRVRHFGLPPTKKLERALGIVDGRDPRTYLHVDEELIASTRAAFKEAAIRRRQQEGQGLTGSELLQQFKEEEEDLDSDPFDPSVLLG